MMNRINTLRGRFALWTAGLMLIIMTIFGAYVYVSMSRGLYRSVDDSLTLNASQIIAGLNIEGDQIIASDSFQEQPENADLRQRGYAIQIQSLQGEVLQEFGPYSHLLPPVSPALSSPTFKTITDSSTQTKIRVYATPVLEGGRSIAILQVAQPLAEVEIILQRLILTLLISIPLLVVIAGLSGYWLAARALQPIDQITSTAQRISAEDLSARLNLPDTQDEVGRLASTLDNMLTRLDESFRRERQFTTDASHELRTPLTAMQAVIGMIREKPRTVRDYQEALKDLSEEVDRLRMLTEDLLQLARSDGKKISVFEQVNLSILITDVSDSLRPLIEAKGLNLTRKIEDGLYLRGDSDDLIRLFVNLFDNAIKFTDQGGIHVRAGFQNNIINIEIEDTGVGISAQHIPHIFERFYRTDLSRSARGSGLGLSIAREIIQSHGGKIQVISTPHQGSKFSICFPA